MSQTEVEKLAQQRKQRLIKYFTEPPDPRDRTVARVCLAVAGIALLATGVIVVRRDELPFALVLLFAAAVCAVVGVEGLFRYRKRFAKAFPRPTDEEMDRLLAAELGRIRSISLEKLGVTADDLELTGEGWDPVAQLERGGPVLTLNERRPLVVFGPADDARMEIGRDHVARFSSYRVMAICPTHFNFGLYLSTVNMLTGALGQDETHEYQYDDVVAIRTITAGERGPEPEVRLRNEDVRFARALECELQVVTSGGEYPRIGVVVPLADGARPASLQPSGMEQVVTSVRRVLRDRRSAGSVV